MLQKCFTCEAILTLSILFTSIRNSIQNILFKKFGLFSLRLTHVDIIILLPPRKTFFILINL